MTTTLAPGLGHAPLFTNAGTGTSPGYEAIDRRRSYGGPLQEGVMAAGSFEVTQRAAGVNMSIDIAATAIDAGSGVAAYVQGDAITGQGLYAIPAHTAVINEAISAAHATLPRVDRVTLEVLDTTHDASGSNLAQTRVVAGTATSGATLDNLTGAAAVPSSALLLADVLVPAADTTIANSQIRDRRKWARGAYCIIERTAGNYSTASTSRALIDSTNLNPRIECGGSPLRLTLSGRFLNVAATGTIFAPWVDGASIGGQTDTFQHDSATVPQEGGPLSVAYTWTPPAGSHRIGWAWRTTGGAGVTLRATAANPLVMTIEELVRQNAANNSTTTG